MITWKVEMKPLEKASYDTGILIHDYPPRWGDRNKRLVFKIACSSASPFEGRMTYASWLAE